MATVNQNLADVSLALGRFREASDYAHQARQCRMKLGLKFKVIESAKTEGYALFYSGNESAGKALLQEYSDSVRNLLDDDMLPVGDPFVSGAIVDGSFVPLEHFVTLHDKIVQLAPRDCHLRREVTLRKKMSNAAQTALKLLLLMLSIGLLLFVSLVGSNYLLSGSPNFGFNVPPNSLGADAVNPAWPIGGLTILGVLASLGVNVLRAQNGRCPWISVPSFEQCCIRRPSLRYASVQSPSSGHCWRSMARILGRQFVWRRFKTGSFGSAF